VPRFPVAFRPAAFASRVILFPPGNSASLMVGPPDTTRARTRTGFPRSTPARYDRVGCPLYNSLQPKNRDATQRKVLLTSSHPLLQVRTRRTRSPDRSSTTSPTEPQRHRRELPVPLRSAWREWC
jgi:hypothetical protein